MNKTMNKIGTWVMTAVVCVMAVTGCEEVEPPPLRGGDSVTILSVTPDALPDGAEQQCTVSVEYTLVHQAQCDLYIAFNTAGMYDFRVHDSHPLTKSGNGSHTFNVAVTSAYWPDGDFQVRAYLGDAGNLGGGTVSDTALAYDSKTIPLNDNYWTIAWDLNGGDQVIPVVKYPDRVAKGGLLTQPSRNRNPYKRNYLFDGWYADSALTQPYNFADPVTADLNLYAKWRDPAVTDLYGTWKGHVNNYISALTISANGIRWDDGYKTGEYIQYANVVWTQNESNLYKFTFTGTQTASSYHSSNGSSFSEINLDITGYSLTLNGPRGNQYPYVYDKQ